MPKILGMTEKKNLKQLIKESGISHRELAIRVGISYPLISKWNREGANPKLETMINLARELKVSLKILAESMGKDTTGIPDDCNKGGNEDK